MFIAFDSTKDPDAAGDKDREPSPRNPKSGTTRGRVTRRGVVPRACGSCRRRKIKCNGEKPCEACRWYKRPQECTYPENERLRIARTSPSPDYRSALSKLFPDTAPEQLVDLPREKLLELMSGNHAPQVQHSPATTTSANTAISVLPTDRPTLESLHSIPRDELGEIPGPPPVSSGHISDDVNALSLLARPPTSYLGISSVQAALRAIAWNHPEYNFSISPTVSRQQAEEPLSPLSASLASLQFTENQLVDAYFANFHAFAPLLDEDAFRKTHLAGNRQDSRWLALRDIVLALGSIVAAVDVNDRTHCTLGLHRELCDSRSVYDRERVAHEDFRRRVWWSLCCLETWGQETLGRPGMNFFTASITVNPPRLVDKDNYLEIVPLIENVEFVKVASKIQESLATPPALSHTEMAELDAQLLQWWNNMPPVLRDSEPQPTSIYSVRTVMRWRFYTQQMLLYRPALLNQTMRRIPLIAIRADERNAIQRCRESAELVILDIAQTTNVNRMLGWNAVWFLFQATMVPLICLSGVPVDNNLEVSSESCRNQVQTAIIALDRMRPYSPNAGRTFEVISSLFSALLPGSDVQPPDTNRDEPMSNSLSEGMPVASEHNAEQGLRGRPVDEAAGFFDNLPPEYMWEYLSWGPNDLWPDLSTLAQGEAMPFAETSTRGPGPA